MHRIQTSLTLALVFAGLVAPAAFAQPELEEQREILDSELTADQAKAHESLDTYLQWDHATGNWWGARTTLEQHGVFVGANLTFDVSGNFAGGLKRGAVYRQLFTLDLTVETGPLINWKGGTFYISFANYAGGNGTDELVGDLQGFDNLDTDEFTALYELWYQQSLFDDLIVVTVGKIDANALFAYVEAGSLFLNSSAGYPPTIVGMQSYPNPAMSFNVFVNPADWFYAGVGWYDGSGDTGTKGPATFFHNEDGYFLIGELGFKWNLIHASDQPLYDGRLCAGGWGHTGTFDRFDGTTQDGTAGFYIMGEQTVWQFDPANADRKLTGFLQYGWADPEISEIEHFIGAGLTCYGPIPGRPDDSAGLYVAAALLSSDAGFASSQETDIELTYAVQVTPFFSIQPSIEYIFNPGGDTSGANSLVGTLRFSIDF